MKKDFLLSFLPISITNIRSKMEKKIFKILINFRKNQPSVSQPKAADILGELFDSDSEQNISLHSARTPITAFFNRSSLRSKSFETSSFEVEGENILTYKKVFTNFSCRFLNHNHFFQLDLIIPIHYI